MLNITAGGNVRRLMANNKHMMAFLYGEGRMLTRLDGEERGKHTTRNIIAIALIRRGLEGVHAHLLIFYELRGRVFKARRGYPNY